ncbi:DNA ligase [Paenibacillus sp. MWE-103]|uniref:DNA ligase (ATP) n=1 Tax=Paenibacillus artemisiicola TaxID=1172618 RepID=A0ABS3WGA7_9BACL|nr:DNA ligase [Paenibacillus artemisiicola]MBO7747160.1 DNA ligase [Paenibacillus artemisiicola]
MLFEPVPPMIVSMGREAFDDDGYLFEPKWDGWRIQLHKQGGRIEAYTRSGLAVTDKFPELAEAAAAIKAPEAILDCEGVCLRGERTVFDDFAYRGRLADPKRIAAAAQTHPATFVAFDVLRTAEPHLREPLAARKARLAELVAPNAALALSMHVEGRGRALQAWTVERNLEGTVAKRLDGAYRPGVVAKDWIKVKNVQTIDAIVLGYRTKPRFALVLGLHFRTIRFKPVGTVEFGFAPHEKQAFLEIARQLHAASDRKTQWIEPKLCCRVQYLERTDRHQLRETVFRGFLFDKSPEDCRWTY